MRPKLGTPKARGGPRQSGQFRVPKAPQQQLQEQSDNDSDLDDAMIFDDEEGGTRIGDIYIPPPVPPYCSMESTGPRLIIKKILNKNFKSYAGEVSLGPFHQSFTAIIGPNGSGKSNVIDSMLFVFGCRSNRIRCKKLSTLIHSSAKYPNLRSCSVSVYFELIVDKGEGVCETVPGSEFVVERVAMADNTSFYRIGDKRVQLKEVVKLLKEHHVDLEHNRFLILQGEVELISMMKPKGQTENETGMLEYLEDIIGTRRYRRPLQQINQRVDQLTDERTEKHNRCKLAEREMKDLEQPYNDAVDYLRLENKRTRLQNWICQNYISTLKKKLEEQTKTYDMCAENLKTHDDGTAAIKKERVEKEQFIRKEMEAYDALIKSREDLKKKLLDAERSFKDVQSNMENTNKARHKDKEHIEKNDGELIKLRKLPEKNQPEIDECNHKLERLEKKEAPLKAQLEQATEKYTEKSTPLQEKVKEAKDELIGIKDALNSINEEIKEREVGLTQLKHQKTIEARKYESLKTSYEESQIILKEKRDKLNELVALVPKLHTEIAAKTEQTKKYLQEEHVLKEQLDKLQAQINERYDSVQSQRSNSNVVKFLMRMKMEGKIPGILGRLGDLGGIDAKYDVAISTCCGRLENIVVDRLDTAQVCIEALKKYNIGRASFIALDKVQNQAYPIQTPENVPRLYDLVKIEDERVRPAFFFALGNTVVANDLDQASRIGYSRERFRVVTLSGDIIEQAGTMSGGGNRAIRGRMGTKVQTKTRESMDGSQMSEKALEELQVQASELQSRINYCQEQQSVLEKELNQLKLTLQKNKPDQTLLSVSIRSLEDTMEKSLKKCEEQKTRMEQTTTDEVAVNAAELAIAKLKERLAKTLKAELAINSKTKPIKAEIDRLREENVKPLESKLKELYEQMSTLKSNVNSLNTELTAADRKVKAIEKNNDVLRKTITINEEKLRALNEERQKCQEQIEEFEKQAKEAEELISNAMSQSSDIKKEIDVLSKQEAERNKQRVDMDNDLQAATSKINETKSQIPVWRAKLKPLLLNEIPGETEPQKPLETFTEEELCDDELNQKNYECLKLEEELNAKKPNLSIIDEFTNKRDVYLQRVQVLEDITSKRNEMRDKYEEVRKRRYNEFVDGFTILTRKLKEMYQMITLGGDAELELVDSMDPFTEGVSFSVRPPKKSWKNITNLSGGEKTLSSLALVFALHYYKPSPLYFMDEIDAALDFKNVSIVGYYIKERTKNAQFIIVSLRANMFELANYLVGIYKVHDCTDSITLINSPEAIPELRTRGALATAAADAMLLSVHTENDENVAPPEQDLTTAPHRDTTFAPPIRSTLMSRPLYPETSMNIDEPAEVISSTNSVIMEINSPGSPPVAMNTN